MKDELGGKIIILLHKIIFYVSERIFEEEYKD